jgi:uncharacterized membrane protein
VFSGARACAYTARMPRLIRIHHAFLQRPRLSGAAAFALVLFAALDTMMARGQALLLTFDIACAIYLGSVAWMMVRATPQSFRRRAERQVEGKWTVLVLSLVISGVILLSLRTELHASKGGASGLDLALAGTSIVLSWLFFSVVFAQQYAHSDHLERLHGKPGLLFPGDATPDYWDYLYFAVVLSMTFQTSDVDIADRGLRHMALLHSIVAFFFNVFIIALTVNVVAGLL